MFLIKEKQKIKQLLGNGVMLKDSNSLELAKALAPGLLLLFPDDLFLQSIKEAEKIDNLWHFIEVGDILRNINPYNNETRYKVTEKTESSIRTISEGYGGYLNGFNEEWGFIFSKCEIEEPHFDRLNFHF